MRIEPATGIWTGNSYPVLLLGEKHTGKPAKAAETGPVLIQRDSKGDRIAYFYVSKAATLEWGRQLTSKPPMSQAEYEPGQVGLVEAMVVLVDSHGYPLDATPYAGRKLRVTGRLTAGGPKSPVDGSQLRANYDPKLPFQVSGVCLPWLTLGVR